MYAKRLKRIAIVLTAIGLALAVTGIIGVYLFTFPGIEIERVSFTTEGYDSPPRKVSGLLLKPDNPVEVPTPAVIFCHGSHLSNEAYFGVCREIAKSGLMVLAIDLRGHGSTGGGNDWGYSEMRDAWAGADYLSEREEVDGERIAITGHSLGGVTATRAGLFQEDGKITVVAPVWCYQGGEESLEDEYGPVGDYIGRIWPFLAASRVYDIHDEEELEKREVISHVDLENPPNYLLVAGTKDEYLPVGHMEEIMRAATGESEVVPGVTYGSFDDGTARRFIVTEDTHVTQLVSSEAWNAVNSWIFEAFELEEPEPVTRSPAHRFLFQAFILVGFLLVAVGFFYFVRFFFKEKPDDWEPGISTDRVGDYRKLAVASILLYMGVCFASFPLAKALGLRAFIPFTGLIAVAGPDVFSSQAAGHIIMLMALMPLLAVLARRWELPPFDAPDYFGGLFSRSRGRSEAGYAEMGIWAKLAIGIAPFALFLVLYAPTAYGLYINTGFPISVPGFLSLLAVLVVYLFLEGHFFHAFLLPAWGDLGARWRRVLYILSEAGIRSIGFAVAFVPIVWDPLTRMAGPDSRMAYPLVPAAFVLGLLIFVPVSLLTFVFRRRGYGVLAISVSVALFASWFFSTQLAIRLF